MAVRIQVGNTIVKKVTVGVPLAIGTPSLGALRNLDDVNTTGLSSTVAYLKYDSDNNEFGLNFFRYLLNHTAKAVNIIII